MLVACQADVPNLLKDGALDAEAIAAKTGIDADKMSRHLRALANVHVFREVAPDVYENNELSVLFQSESRKAFVGLWHVPPPERPVGRSLISRRNQRRGEPTVVVQAVGGAYAAGLQGLQRREQGRFQHCLRDGPQHL